MFTMQVWYGKLLIDKNYFGAMCCYMVTSMHGNIGLEFDATTYQLRMHNA
jgi:hypothetical protein